MTMNLPTEAELRHNRLIARQNWLTILLTVVIIIVGVCTSLFPIFEYKVINSTYLVRVNNITGNVKYIDITFDLDKATDRAWERATKANPKK